MKIPLIIASQNRHKVKEIQDILRDVPVEVRSYVEMGIPVDDIEENGKTFEENAIIKARAISMHTDGLVMADDSGLCVDALEGAPGVFSARFAGDQKSDSDNRKKLLACLKGVPTDQRTARFMCVIALMKRGELLGVATGSCEGIIAEYEAGVNGFGYDALFFCPHSKKTFAEIEDEEKNLISHRARALMSLRLLVMKQLNKGLNKD